MAWDWLNKIVSKIAAEVHKSKINEFEKRILEIERNQAVILKSIYDNEMKLSKLDDRVYQSNIDSATAVGAIKTLIQSGIQNGGNLIQGGKNEQ